MEYQQVITAVNTAVRQDISTANKWQTAGHAVREFYGTETAVNEVKAQFIADAIIPAMDKKHAAALLKDNVRKGSAEYNALDSAGRDAWESANTAKKDARAIAHTMFSRVVKYAFPAEKVESAPRDLQTRIIEEVAALIKACQKAEAVPFDVQRTITALDSVLSAVVPKQ
jgi:hypothetical protein